MHKREIPLTSEAQQRLFQARRAVGLSMEGLAGKARVSRRWVGRAEAESGVHVDAFHLGKVAEVLGLSPKQILAHGAKASKGGQNQAHEPASKSIRDWAFLESLGSPQEKPEDYLTLSNEDKTVILACALIQYKEWTQQLLSYAGKYGQRVSWCASFRKAKSNIMLFAEWGVRVLKSRKAKGLKATITRVIMRLSAFTELRKNTKKLIPILDEELTLRTWTASRLILDEEIVGALVKKRGGIVGLERSEEHKKDFQARLDTLW